MIFDGLPIINRLARLTAWFWRFLGQGVLLLVIMNQGHGVCKALGYESLFSAWSLLRVLDGWLGSSRVTRTVYVLTCWPHGYFSVT